MRRYTDRYHKARLAEARPIFLLFLGTDRGLRCFGKHTPTPEQIGTELSVLEWSARVLTFGDFRQSLSSDSDSAIKNLYEEEMSSLSCTLDNADGYFSRIAGKETFLNGDVFLYQGFEYPGFEFDDFQEFFTGNTVKVEFDKTSVTVTANAAAQTPPADPPLTSSTIYALTTGGAGEVGAQETYTYAETQPVFYTETWIFITEITITTTGTLQILLDVSNDKYNNTRYQIGIDANNKLFFKYTDDVDTATPTYNTLTSDVTLGTGDTRIEVEYDGVNGNVTFRDNTGQVSIIDLTPTTTGFILDTSWTSVTGQHQIAIGPTANVYVTDPTNNRVLVYDKDGTYLTTFGSKGTGNGQFEFPIAIATDYNGNIYVGDHTVGKSRVQKFNSSYVYQSTIGSAGSADGQFVTIGGIVVSLDASLIYVTDDSLDRVQCFTTGGSFLYKAGTTGSGNGQLDTPLGLGIDSLNNIYIADSVNDRIVKFTSSLAFSANIGTSGSGDGQLDNPYDVSIYGIYIYVSDFNNSRFQKLDTLGTYYAQYSNSGNQTVEYSSFNNRVYTSDVSGSTKRLSETSGFLEFDGSDTGSDDTITIAEDFDGETVTSSFNGAEYVNTNPTNTEFPDIGEDIDLTVVDGTWTEALTIQVAEEIIITTPLDPTEELIVETTELYEHAGPNQQNVPLPYPYGNLRENSDAGVWVCPLINQDDFVYCVAGWPIQSVANGNTVQVYVDGLEVTSGWTFSESTDYQGKGDIAILTFSSDPDGVVTVSCNGKWVDGQLLTNPVDIIEDFLDWAAELIGSTTWNRDLTSFAQAKALTIANGYAAAGVIQANNSVGYWVKSILKCFLGNFRINSNGDISLTFQPLSQSREVFDRLNEYDAITVKAKQIFDNICGRIIINYAVNYADIDKRYKEGGESAYFRTADKSQAAINPQSWSLDFDWCRKTSNIETIQNILLDLYAQPEYIIDYQGQDFKFVPLDLLDQIQAEISFLLDSSGVPVQDVVYSLQHKTVNLDNFTTTMSLQSVNFIDAQKVEAGQVRIGGVDVQIGGVFVTFGT